MIFRSNNINISNGVDYLIELNDSKGKFEDEDQVMLQVSLNMDTEPTGNAHVATSNEQHNGQDQLMSIGMLDGSMATLGKHMMSNVTGLGCFESSVDGSFGSQSMSAVESTGKEPAKTRKCNKTSKKRVNGAESKANLNDDGKRLKQEPVRLFLLTHSLFIFILS